MRQPTKLLLGFALLLMAPNAFAQNNLGELLDGGAKKVSPEEFRQDVVQRTLLSTTPSGAPMELMYTTGGVIQGKSGAVGTVSAGLVGSSFAAIDGVWNVDDSARICTSMVIGRVFLPLRCQYWFKYNDEYFLADSDSDRNTKVLRRTVKQ